MKGLRFAEGIKVLPVLTPADIAATNTWTYFVDLDLANWVTFVAQFGACSSAGATCDDCLIQVMSSSVATTAGIDAIDFTYRLSSAVDTDSMGAITTGTSDGITVGPLLDNKCVVIDVDPSVVAAKGALERWVCLEFTPASTITTVGVIAYIEPKSPGNSIPSST